MSNKDAAKADDKKYETLPPGFYPPKYDPDPITNKLFKPDQTVLVLGRRRTGKTTWATEMLLRRRRVYGRIFVFTKTKRNNYWQQYVPVNKIAQGLDDDTLTDILDLNSRLYEQWKLYKQRTGHVRGNPLTLCVFEDLVAERVLRSSKPLQRVTMNGRHDGTPCYVLAQDFCGLDPGERDNIDEWVLFRPDSRRVLSMVRETFGDDILRVAQRVWKDGRMFIINTAPRIPLEKRVFWYETDVEYVKDMTHRNVALCNRRWWGERDVKSQKKRYPYVELPSTATLIGQFNNDIRDDDDAELAEVDDKDIENNDENGEAPSAGGAKVNVGVVEKPNF